MTTEERLIKAKFYLAKAHNMPFFAYLLFMLKFIEDKKIPTAGTDSEYLYYNPAWINTLTDEEIRGVLIHEVEHLAMGHLWRRGDRGPWLFNIAADFAINSDIRTYPNIKLPQGTLYDPKYKNWSAEQIYYDLQKNIKKINIGKNFALDKNGKPVRGTHAKWGKGQSQAKQKKLQQKWQRAVKQATEIQNKHKGNIPAGLRRLMDESESSVDWKEILAAYASSYPDDYSYRRPDKRFLSSEFIMPDLVEGSKLEEIVVAIDCSGSIDNNTLKRFLGEVKGLLKSFTRIKAYICSFDTQIYGWQEIDNYQMKIGVWGGGGTDTRPIFQEIKKRNITPSVLVFFTDGFCEYPSSPPEYDTIFIVPKRDYEKPPFGRLIRYE